MLLRSFVLLIGLVSAVSVSADEKNTETIVLGGGCFWCVESDFEKIDGVIKAISGYAGGSADNANYKKVSSGRTKHIEVAEITFDNSIITREQILDYFWTTIDPTTDTRQFCDRGPQYRPAIFYANDEEKKLAEASVKKTEETKPFEDELKVELIALTQFYRAEEYHQDYYKKNPLRYKYYRYSCGREKRLEFLWGSPTH